jgi:PPM family protein phosphatase
MGTNVTSALVGEGGRIDLANVGDSRAYLFREGSLRRLSEDHSVVAELVAAGQITEEEAARHPQRNVVTRVLGPEPAVEVDTYTLEAKSGDIVLLCSDGLTDMVAEEEIAAILAHDEPCEQIVRKLIRSALAGGGEDNVTTIVFRMGETDDEDRTGAPHRILTVDPDLEAEDEDDRPSVNWRRVALSSAIAIVIIAALGTGAVVGLRESHFVGANEATGRIEVYQGIPIDLFAGIKLYHAVYASPVTYASLDPQARKELFDHRLRSLDDARDAVRRIEEGSP